MKLEQSSDHSFMNLSADSLKFNCPIVSFHGMKKWQISNAQQNYTTSQLQRIDKYKENAYSASRDLSKVELGWKNKQFYWKLLKKYWIKTVKRGAYEDEATHMLNTPP